MAWDVLLLVVVLAIGAAHTSSQKIIAKMIDHVLNVILAHAVGATFSPEEALVVLNVLPANRAPSVLAAALSRGFKEFDPTLAIKHGFALALLPHYPAHILFEHLNKTLVAAGILGDLPTVELLWKLAGPTTPGRIEWCNDFGFLEELIKQGNLPVLEWFANAARTAGIPIA
ncbi:hypothetical protein BC828DRAFT_420669 [Blastocladiella britannica]|nr:hypothetical protein BC828DRAFT_420669 [Blastocladiella britannica]